MKLFLDTADVEEIRTVARWGVLDGVTTNPSLYAKVGGAYEDILREICDLTPGPVSAEVVAEDVEGMLHERARPGGHQPLRGGGHQDELHAHLLRQPGTAGGQGRSIAALALRGPAR
jgi:hypothetical protein